MNEVSETFDNYPLINSFLTTIQEHHTPTIHPQFAPGETLQPIAKKAEEWFQAESKALYAKRERQLIKRNRLKQLQIEFEEQRARKQKELDHKLANIEKNKIKNITHIQEKLHKVSARHTKVLSKVQQEHFKYLEEQYKSRQNYQNESSRRSTRLINTSHHSASADRQRALRDSKTKTSEEEEVSQKMGQISQRLDKATTMYRQRREETANKARNHNVLELYHVQTKAKEQYEDYLKLYAHRIISKMENADQHKDKLEKNLEKKNEERQKAYSQKLKRIQTNLLQLQEEQEQKFEELTKKLEKPSSCEKGVKEHRETVYHKRFLNNLQRLQRQKMSRADQIIQKHQEITLKNKLLKEKKQTLYKNMKVEAS